MPTGFATTAHAFREFLAYGGLIDRINARLATLDIEDVRALAAAGAEIRGWVRAAAVSGRARAAIREDFTRLSAGQRRRELRGALLRHRRGPAGRLLRRPAGDLPQRARHRERAGHDASEVFASLYNDRAISYRVHKGFAHADVALSAGVQRMVRSDLGAAGVMFTIDTESGFRDVVFITSSYGLGETVVQGAVNPDEFYVHKPMLRAGKRAVIRRNLGSKLIKMVFGTARRRRRTASWSRPSRCRSSSATAIRSPTTRSSSSHATRW